MTQHSERRSLALGWFVEHARFTVHPWPDSSIDCASYDARHSYVEHFWLPVLGPSSVLALRRFADWFENRPAGVEVDLVEFGSSLGIGTGTGRHTQVNRTLGRLVDFRLARISGDHLDVHTMLPPVPHQLRRRLPLGLLDALAEHDRRCASSA